MIALDFYNTEAKKRKSIVKDFRESNLKNRNSIKIDKIQEWCHKYLNDVYGKAYGFNEIIEAEPSELLKLKNYMDETYGDKLSDIMKELSFSNKKNYIETTLYTKMSQDALNILFDNLNVGVCPYCNRNYVISNEKIRTCELDHFIPKSKYPIFASSFYNLIPSCSYCNKRKKESEFYFYPHNHVKSTDDTLKFSYIVLGSNFLSDLNDIKLELEVLDDKYNAQAEILNLKQLYENHKDMVQDVLIKNEIFSDSYINAICNDFRELFTTPQEVKEIIYGISLNSNEYGKRPMSKLLKDIVHEVSLSVATK